MQREPDSVASPPPALPTDPASILSATLQCLDKIQVDPSSPSSLTCLAEAQRLLSAMLAGLSLAAVSTPHPSVSAQPSSKTWADVAKAPLSGAANLPTGSRLPPPPSAPRSPAVEARTAALSSLRAARPLVFAVDRQAFLLPTEFRAPCPQVVFRAALQQYFSSLGAEAPAVEFCKSLRRGGYKIQVSESTLHALEAAGNPSSVDLPDLGRWTFQPLEPSVPTFVIEGISTQIPDHLILEGLVAHLQAESLPFSPSVFQLERFQRRSDQGTLRPLPLIRVSGPDTAVKAILVRKGFYLQGIPYYCRPYYQDPSSVASGPPAVSDPAASPSDAATLSTQQPIDTPMEDAADDLTSTGVRTRSQTRTAPVPSHTTPHATQFTPDRGPARPSRV